MHIIILFLLTILNYSVEAQNLKIADVHTVMEQIFKEHVGKKELTAPAIQDALHTYVDQFDPNRVYLLDSEVQPFFQLNQWQLQEIIERYRQDDLSVFRRLNAVFQNSIQRAREYRAKYESVPERLFKMSQDPHYLAQKEEWRDSEQRRLFALNKEELEQRILNELVQFIRRENNRFGFGHTLKNKGRVFQLYEDALRQHENSYLGVDSKNQPLPQEEQESLFVMHVLKALSKDLDAHTSVLDSKEASEMRARLEKEEFGIGIRVQKKDQRFFISELLATGPAEKSGRIHVGDELITINGAPLDELTLKEVEDLLHTSQPEVALSLQSKGVPVSVQLLKEKVPINEGRVETAFETFGNGIIGKIALHMFYQGSKGVSSEEDIKNAIYTLQKKGNLRGIVLDLRDNMGGFLSQAIKVVGLFITSGVVVISKYADGEEKIYRDVDGKVVYSGPLVILTSRKTASAAEIVAQALQDYGVAVVVGDDQTFGKGTIQSQTITEEDSPSFFKVTVGKYYTVSGKTPQMQGVKADIVAPSYLSNLNIGEKYLSNTVPADSIAPEYVDDLTGVSESLKPWYLNYYVPNIQPQNMKWKNKVPILKRNSEYRIAHNKNYQILLKKIKGEAFVSNEEDEEWVDPKTTYNFGSEDVQMEEAVNVLKDMILLEAMERHKT